MTGGIDLHEMRPRKDKCGVDSDAVIRAYDGAGNVIETHNGRVQRVVIL